MAAHDRPAEQYAQLQADIAGHRDHLPFLMGLLGHRALSLDEHATSDQAIDAALAQIVESAQPQPTPRRWLAALFLAVVQYLQSIS